MYHFSPRKNPLLTVAAAFCVAATCQLQAQMLLASSSTTTTPNTPTPNSAPQHIAPERFISAQIHDGILTIDGMVAKVQLNYNLQHNGYLYFFVPGTGTAVVSLSPMPGAEKVQDAFDGPSLRFTAAGHTIELSNDGTILLHERSKLKEKSRADAYVRFDTSASTGRYPRMGFGDTAQAPFEWPVSAPSSSEKYAASVAPPPVPQNLLQTSAVSTPHAPRSIQQ
jgi:hypothetical protein